MKDQRISFKTAKLAKEKGFNEPCIYTVDEGDIYVAEGSNRNLITNEFYLTAPTQSLLLRWLRETYDIDVTVNPGHTTSGIKYYFHCISKNEKYDVCGWQKLHTKIMDKAHQDIEGNYINNELYDKYIFEDGFAFKTFEDCLEDGLIKALKLIR